jgi:hypothetical protein
MAPVEISLAVVYVLESRATVVILTASAELVQPTVARTHASLATIRRRICPPTRPLGWNFGNSTDGTYGGANGMTCGSLFGECCNKDNVCGSLPSDCEVRW